MEEGKRKVICDALQAIEGLLAVEMLGYWRDKKINEFWSSVESFDKFLQMKSKFCQE